MEERTCYSEACQSSVKAGEDELMHPSDAGEYLAGLRAGQGFDTRFGR
jgi:hypothetical protein